DLDLCCMGSAEIDLGNVAAHISELSLRTFGDIDALQSVQQALLDRYSELRPLVDPYAIEALSLLSLARHIHISSRIGSRRRYVPAVIQACERKLELLSTGA
ncbi:MAG: aminoglycoside phosphotransferase family protein, partial [Phycisphaerae bacterium]|nr:aminoglycoside phosphotransferase family protein [Phycisphaerae bacterium]